MLSLLFVTPIIVMILGMWGGQGFLQARRYILPSLVTIVGIIWHIHIKQSWWEPLPLLVLMGVLTMGYGEKSLIHGLFPLDWTDRLIYALLLSIPLIVTAILCHHLAFGLLVIPCLIGAFEIRAGKVTTIGKFDILLEDIVRYLTLGILCMVVIL